MFYVFNFKSHVDMTEVDESLMLAALATECIHGRTAIKLDAVFSLIRCKREVTIRIDSEVGKAIGLIFCGFATKEFGERSFRVAKLDKIHDDPFRGQ